MALATPLSKRHRIRQWLPFGSTHANRPNLPALFKPSTSHSNNALGTSTATQLNFLNRVLLLLSQQDQDTIREHTVTNTTDVDAVVQQALDAASRKQATCQAKRWTFTFGGHTVVLRGKADNIMKWLDRFKQVGDIASNADPVHVGLPWAGIRLLLQVSIVELLNNITNITNIIFVLTALRLLLPNKARWRLSSSASKQPFTCRTDCKCT